MERDEIMKKTAALLYAGFVLALAPESAAQSDPAAEREPAAQSDRAEDAKKAVTGFKIVINRANPKTELTTKDVQRIFYKRTTRWEDWQGGGDFVRVTPIDRERGAEVRKLFSKKIFRKSTSAIESYWQRQIFSGEDIPPDKLATEAEVIEFVRRNRGAIGYVSQDAVLADGVKELRISD